MTRQGHDDPDIQARRDAEAIERLVESQEAYLRAVSDMWQEADRALVALLVEHAEE